MGIHSGELQQGENVQHGMGLVRGAQICAAARGGQVICSDVVRGLLEAEALEGLTLRDLGEFAVKGLDRTDRLHQLVAADLPDALPDQPLEATSTTPRFGLLGPLEARDDRGPVALGGHKQKIVLAVLLLDAGRAVSTDRLIDALWGENPPRTAPTSLQNFVSQLRKVVGADMLVTQPPGYLLRIDPDELDVNRFTRMAAAAQGAEPEERAATLRAALGLWRGAALADFTYEAFAVNEISRREGLRSLLMLALYRSGRQAEALQVYSSARRALVDELGLEPSPVLHDLHNAILRQDSSLQAVAREQSVEDHYDDVARALLAGRIVPVLGADVAELAVRLAEMFEYPDDDRSILARVSQYIAVMKGSGPLYDELHAVLDTDTLPTGVHRLLAAIPRVLRERGVPHQLLVTTSYDLALEQALLDAGEEFDVVAYLAAGRYRGRFCHIGPHGAVQAIERPNEYVEELSLEQRTVVLKLHGQVDRTPTREWESFVVTEDDYIDYLSHADVSSAVPVALAAKLRRSHFLFLGYRMSDWNLRVILNRLWGDNPLSYHSWAVQPGPRPLEREFWRRREVDVLDVPLEEYADTLAVYAGLEPAELTR
jgi:DNA-binding SARP family transcriptional activator